MFFWKYRLEYRQAPNARRKSATAEGALLRIGDGVGCLHPWVELGDAPLASQLDALRSGVDTPMTRRAKYCCALDGAARRANQSLFDGLVIPKSHAVFAEFLDPNWLERFSFLKLKCGPDIQAEAERLRELVGRFPNAQWRIDFNATLTSDEFLQWAHSLRDLWDKIDFVEDPMESDSWEDLQRQVDFDLAADRVKVSAPVVVKKPLVDSVEDGGNNVVITSYMDHPVGQVFAAVVAARQTLPLRGAGLITHTLLEPDPFTELLGVDDAGRLLPPTGTGLGFDSLLENLPWQKLSQS